VRENRRLCVGQNALGNQMANASLEAAVRLAFLPSMARKFLEIDLSAAKPCERDGSYGVVTNANSLRIVTVERLKHWGNRSECGSHVFGGYPRGEHKLICDEAAYLVACNFRNLEFVVAETLDTVRP
jgi:hypothetical protein